MKQEYIFDLDTKKLALARGVAQGKDSFQVTSLETFFLPAGAVSLGENVFNNCGSLREFTVADGNSAFRAENGHLIERATNTLIRGGHNAVVPDGVSAIGEAAFRRSERRRFGDRRGGVSQNERHRRAVYPDERGEHRQLLYCRQFGHGDPVCRERGSVGSDRKDGYVELREP